MNLIIKGNKIIIPVFFVIFDFKTQAFNLIDSRPDFEPILNLRLLSVFLSNR